MLGMLFFVETGFRALGPERGTSVFDPAMSR
jgi:hypothetical protein